MAIASSDKLVVVKAFAPGNPLPIDAREIYESLAEATAYAKSSAVAYAGQTIKVVEGGVVTAYNLVPSDVEGTNFTLQFAGGGEGGVQNVTTSSVAGNVSVSVADEDTFKSKDVPVVGALINPVVDEDAHTLTLTKVGATTAQNSEVVIPLGQELPGTIMTDIDPGTLEIGDLVDDTLSMTIFKYNPETKMTSSDTIKLYGAVTSTDTSTSGLFKYTKKNKSGSYETTSRPIIGSVINASYNSSTKVLTLPVVTGINESKTAATVNNVTVDLNAAVAGMFVGVTVTDDTADKSAKIEFTYKDAAGTDQKTAIYESGVRKVEAGSVADKIKVTTADKTGALTSSEILVGAGSVKNPTYDSDQRKITLPILQADGTTTDLEIALGKDMVVKSGKYNTVTKDIELTLTDGSVVKIPAGALVDVYTGDATATVTVAVSDTNVITATVKVSTTAANNVLKSGADGLYVSEDDFTVTKGLITSGVQEAKDYADTEIGKEATARDQAIATAKSEAITAANNFTDAEITKEITARGQAIATAKSEAITAAKDYTDGQITTEVTARNSAIEAAKTELKAYADENAASVGTTWVDFGAEA